MPVIANFLQTEYFCVFRSEFTPWWITEYRIYARVSCTQFVVLVPPWWWHCWCRNMKLFTALNFHNSNNTKHCACQCHSACVRQTKSSRQRNEFKIRNSQYSFRLNSQWNKCLKVQYLWANTMSLCFRSGNARLKQCNVTTPVAQRLIIEDLKQQQHGTHNLKSPRRYFICVCRLGSAWPKFKRTPTWSWPQCCGKTGRRQSCYTKINSCICICTCWFCFSWRITTV